MSYFILFYFILFFLYSTRVVGGLTCCIRPLLPT